MMWPYGVLTFLSHRGRAGPAAPRGATSSSSTASTYRERARRSTSTARSTVFAAGAAILCCMAISPAGAHDASHPELDGWYKKLESGKGPCCDGSDSVHVEPSDWETQNKPRSHYKVRLDGVWADVPDEAVVTGPNRDGRTLVWYYDGWTGHSGIPGKVIKCFMPGTMT